MVNIGDSVFPGDLITDINHSKNVTVIGPGLRRNEDLPSTLLVSQIGKLCFKPPNTYWIQGNKTRYIPKKGDLIVGIVVKKSSENLKIDIGSAEFASLSMYAFEGATKKQKPDVQIGGVVYAKLLNAHREMEPELVCVDSHFKAGRLGVLSDDGFVITVENDVVQRLLSVENPLLRTLGKMFPYEIAVGVNGKVWIKAKKPKDVLTIVRALRAVEKYDDKSVKELCRQIK